LFAEYRRCVLGLLLLRPDEALHGFVCGLKKVKNAVQF
jgi:hypothetical protein